MSKILILSSYYLGAATANGICARNIAKQLKQDGHDVSVLCYDKGEPEEQVYTVICPSDRYSQHIAMKLCRAVRAVVTPRLNQKLVADYTAAALRLCEEKNIDTVVCMFFPFETAPVMMAVKRKFPHIRTVLYELDSVGDGILSGSKYQALVKKAFERWSSRQYRYADSVIVMQTHASYWEKTFGKQHENKLKYADIPVLVEKQLPCVEKSADAPVSFLYGGLIERAYRAPDHLLSVFAAFAAQEKATLDFYSKGDCEGLIADRAKKTPGIAQHGYVPEAVLDVAIAKADVLVSIGNRVSRSVPSKLITYFAYGKPVVHFSSQKDDVCAQYLEQYPLGLVLREWDSVAENAQKLRQFVKENCGKTVDFSDVAQALQSNTPAYSASLITGSERQS